MDYRVDFSPQADAQLRKLYLDIALAGRPVAAESFVSSIIDYCEGFSLFPNRGTQRDDIRPGLRIVGFRHRVTIAFTVEAANVVILGIFYGGQNWETDINADRQPPNSW